MITEQILNGFFQNPFVSSAFLWAPLLVFGVSLWLMRYQHIAIKIISPFLFSFSTFCFCYGTMLGWVLRDGLGPGMEVTEGPEAIAKFMEEFWPLCIFCVSVFFSGFVPCVIVTFIPKKNINPIPDNS